MSGGGAWIQRESGGGHADILRTVPVKEVHIDGIALLKIIKHCNECFPTLVAGSLLGLDANGTLEITYAYPFPASRGDGDRRDDDIDGQEYQIEMMKMLRDVNVDNNCVGWYQSMYLGTMKTIELVDNQYVYQSSEDLSDNCVIFLYDPLQSKKGSLLIKALRLSDDYVNMRRAKAINSLKTQAILVEVPIKIKNSGHSAAFLRCLQDTQSENINAQFASFSSQNNLTDRHLELINSWTEDVVSEQHKFQQYAKTIAKPRQEQIKWLSTRIQENHERRDKGEPELSTSLDEAKPLPEAQSRVSTLLMLSQLEIYASQLNSQTDAALQKLLVTSKLHGTK